MVSALNAALAAWLMLLCGCSGPAAPSGTAGKQTGPSAPLGGVWHQVQQGETVKTLALRYGVPRGDIEEINGLERWAPVAVGRQLFVPGAASGPASRPVDARGGPGRREAGAKKPTEAPAAAAGRDQAEAKDFIWPLRRGTLMSGFTRGGATPHEGVDIAAAEGTAVLAAADGKVIYSGSGVKGYGNLILVRHLRGLVTVYAHNRINLVREKALVRKGQVIAEVGHTGHATGDHLHFELREGDKPIDPRLHLPPWTGRR